MRKAYKTQHVIDPGPEKPTGHGTRFLILRMDRTAAGSEPRHEQHSNTNSIAVGDR